MPLSNRRHFSIYRGRKKPILWTYGAPGLKIIALLVVVGLTLPNLGKGQNPKLEPISGYEASIRAFHEAKIRTQCVEFAASTKKKWWYYIPQLGFNFGLPTVNGGTSTFVTLDQQKQQNRVKLASIKSQGLLDYQTELHQLRSLYQTLVLEQEAIVELDSSWMTQRKIFAIAEEAHQKKEIKPLEYYQALLTKQNAASTLSARRHEYQIRLIELARFARHEFPFSEGIVGLDDLGLGSDSTKTSSVSSPILR